MSEDFLRVPARPADTRVAYGSDANQFLDLRFPSHKSKTESRLPLLINIHGGFWRAKYDLAHAGHLCVAATAKGLVSANLEYRRVGNDGGGWPGTFADIRAAYQFLIQNASRYSFDVNRVIVMGHSAGGQLALCLAAHESSLRRVVSLAGIVDLQRAYELHLSNNAVVEFLHGTPSEVPNHYREADPVRLSIPRATQWLIHGSADDTVPPALSRDYVSRKKTNSQQEDLHLLEIPGADHYDLINPSSATWKQVEEVTLQLVA